MSFFDNDDFKTVAVIFAAEFLLGILVATKTIPDAAFLFLNILLIAYIGGKQLPFIQKTWFKKEAIRLSEAELWKRIYAYMREYRLPFGYPAYYFPENTLIMPSLGLFLVEVNKDDLAYFFKDQGINFTMEDLEGVDWEGVIIYSLTEEIVTSRLRNKKLEEVKLLIEKSPSSFTKTEPKQAIVPLHLKSEEWSYS